MRKRLLWTLLSVLVIASFLMGCAGQPTPEPTEEPAAEATEPPEAEPTEEEAEPTEEPPTPTAEPEEAAEPKVLRVRMYGDIQNLDPAFRISENDEIVSNAVMNGLVRYCPNSYEIGRAHV